MTEQASRDTRARDTQPHRDTASRPPAGTVTAVTAGAVVLVALTVWARVHANSADTLPALDITVGVVSCTLIPLLWRWPVVGALALAALATLSPAATPPATLSALLVANLRTVPVAGAVAAAGIAAQAVQGLWRPSGGISYGWWLVLVTAGYGALVGWGALARSHRALVTSLRERARRAEAEQGRRVAEARMLERTRLAREMHDVLAHRLSLLATYAGALEYRPDAPAEQLSRAAGVVRAGVHQALDELRGVIIVLRDDEMADDTEVTDTGRRPQPGLADVPALVDESRDAGQPVRLRDEVADVADVAPAVSRAAFRVVQEGLTNARKHAPGQPVRVGLSGRAGDGLVIEVRNRVRDDGDGPSPPGSGTGLIGLTERVRLVGGRLDHETTTDHEFGLRAWLPWPG